MVKENDVKQRLLDVAKEEFFEKGYKSASLRNICKKTGVTTGAAYFFFENKEDLFSAVVMPFWGPLCQKLYEHTKEERDIFEKGTVRDTEIDIAVSKFIVHSFYENRKVATILLDKSVGTRFEKISDQLVELIQSEFIVNVDVMNIKIDPWIINWFSHIVVDSFIRTLLYFDTEEEAMPRILLVVKIIQNIWDMLLEKTNNSN